MLRSVRIAVIAAAALALPALSHAAFINFGATVTNLLEGPTSYEFTFGTPVTPDFYSQATSILEFTVTPGPSGEARVDVTPGLATYLEGFGEFGLLSTNLGVDLGSTACIATAGAPQTCQFSLVSNTFPPTFFDGLSAVLSFDLTGAGASAMASGRVTMDAAAVVPEPGTLLLLGAGLVATLRARRQ